MRAVVVGAGIAGLTAAIALRRAGIDVVVLERAPDVATAQVGAGVFLAPNGTAALDRLGLFDRVAEVSSRPDEQEFRKADGALLARWRVGPDEPQLSAERVRLHRVLVDALDKGVLRAGSECIGFEQDEAGVTVSLAGGVTERCDVLIGADGLRSTVRKQLRGPEPLRYAGYIAWRMVVDFDDADPSPTVFRMLWGRGRRFASYGVGPNRRYAFGVTTAPEDSPAVPRGERKGYLLEQFGSWMPPTSELIESAEPDAIHQTPIYDRPPTNRWGEGRVTLLGDAAHPATFNLGQGACQGIEDGLVLAECLAAGGEAAAALRAYEARRMPRTAAITALSWRVGAAGGWRNRIACAARDTFFRVAFTRVVIPRQKKYLAAAP